MIYLISFTDYCQPPTPSPTWNDIPPNNINQFCKGQNLELVLFLDTSWSILEDINKSWNYAKNFSADIIQIAYDIINNISIINDKFYTLKVSLITFSNDAELIYNLDEFGVDGISSDQDLKEAQEIILNIELPDIKYRNNMEGTHIRDAIELYLDKIKPNTNTKESGLCLIMITDGRPDHPQSQNPCYQPQLGNDLKSNGALFTLLTINNDINDFNLNYFKCLMDDPQKQSIQLSDAQDLYQITQIIDNKLKELVCNVKNAICDYPLYPTQNISSLKPKYKVINKTIYNPINQSNITDLIEYQFTINNLDFGYLWITKITITIYNLDICQNNRDPYYLTAYIVGINGESDVAIISNVTIIDIDDDKYVYNIIIPISDYQMKEGNTYRLGIKIDNLFNCGIDYIINPKLYPSIPCTISDTIQFSTWYYFNNVTVYYGDSENNGLSLDPSSCIPLIQLCLIEPFEPPTRGPTTAPTIDPTLPTSSPSTNPTDNPLFDPTFNPTMNPTNYPTLIPTIDPTTSLPTTSLPTTALPTTALPTTIPTMDPTLNPITFFPTEYPTFIPTRDPLEPGDTHDPTPNPSHLPTNEPSEDPSITPTTSQPITFAPSISPTLKPSKSPLSQNQTYTPTHDPSQYPTNYPTNNPTIDPTINPTLFPSVEPSEIPTQNPSAYPTTPQPTPEPTSRPSKLNNHKNDNI